MAERPIEITPEMVTAGVEALLDHDRDDGDSVIVADVFTAMIQRSTQFPSPKD